MNSANEYNYSVDSVDSRILEAMFSKDEKINKIILSCGREISPAGHSF
jgi:hypothetical protein